LKHFALIAAALAASLTHPASAKAVVAKALVDCAMRDAAFSTTSPLIDVLLSPVAKGAMDKALPGLLDGFPPFFKATTPPSFAAIMTLKEVANFRRTTPINLDALDQELRAIPVTYEDKLARCARYDTGKPDISVPKGKPAFLLFEKINGFRDSPSVDGAHAAFVSMATRNGWTIVTTDKGSAFTPAILKKFDAVIWNNISGDVLTLSQRRAFQSYMEKGGGFVGVHGTAGDPVYFWDWFVDSLIGARFAGHPMSPQFQTARVQLEDKSHPAAKDLPAQWDVNDEWYSFKNNPRASGSRIIATLDESTYKPEGWGNQQLRMGDHPIAWSRCVGKGRVFYSAIGHLPERYSDALNVKMLEQAISWTAKSKGAGCGPADAK
jgi:uncharacterized protein